MNPFRCRMPALLSLAVVMPASLPAQISAPAPFEPDAKFAEGVAEKRVFLPEDFTQFAPKTAADMIDQLPSFTVISTSNDRGLGQASENVLINSARITDKSGGAMDRLRNVPAADVVRIEISEAAKLGIAGLTGQVANVVLKEDRKASGRFEWSPRVRPDYAKPSLLRGKLSYTGTTGQLDYTLSLQNYGNRGAIGGPDYLVLSPTGGLIEQRRQETQNNYDNVRTNLLLKYGGKGPVQANLNIVYNPYWQRNWNGQRRDRTDNNDNDWLNKSRTPGFVFSATGDVSFPLIGGTLKFVGLRRYEHAPLTSLTITKYDSGAPNDGSLFSRDTRTEETIGRAEYAWKGGSNNWQLSLERAYNRLNQVGSRAELQPSGQFGNVPFNGSGIVAEKRYEAVLSLSRPLTGKLDLQVVGGGEFSQLGQTGGVNLAREFFRPKGSISVAWRPARNWDASLKLERKVGQINFSDFLSQADLVLNRQNSSNPDLAPPQSWQLTGELARNFGPWGKTRLKFYAHRIDDIVDFIPIGAADVAVGNLPRANRYGVESTSTVQGDPIGWKGAKVDVTLAREWTSVRDPLTLTNRPISNTRDYWAYVNFRHDIPGSQIAWGAYFNVDHYGSAYYMTEVNRNWEGPYFGLFVEHKNLAGMKVTFDAFNITDARNHFDRVVYTGRRNTAPVSFIEFQNQRVSQIFTLTVTGNF